MNKRIDRRKMRTAVAVLAGSVVFSYTHAQTADPRSDQGSSPRAQEQESAQRPSPTRQQETPQRPSSRTGQQERQTNQSADQAVRIFETADLEGLQVVGTGDVNFGTVDSLALDIQNEEVMFVVVESGGVVGIGSELKVVPVEVIELAQEQGRVREGQVVRIDIEEQRWRELPSFEAEEIARLGEEEQAREIFAHFDIEWEERRAQQFGARQERPGEQREASQRRELVLTSDLHGRGIRGAEQEEIANIENAVVDLQSGRIQYILISPATGFFERSDEVFAVAPRSFRTITRDEATLEITRDQLENAEVLTSATSRQEVGTQTGTTEEPQVFRYEREQLTFGSPDREASDEESTDSEAREETERSQSREETQQFGRPEGRDSEERQLPPGRTRDAEGRPEHRTGPPEDRPPESRPPENRPPENRPPENRPSEDRPSEDRSSEDSSNQEEDGNDDNGSESQRSTGAREGSQRR